MLSIHLSTYDHGGDLAVFGSVKARGFGFMVKCISEQYTGRYIKWTALNNPRN